MQPSVLLKSLLDMSRSTRDMSSNAAFWAFLTLAVPQQSPAVKPAPLPFGPGEVMTYSVVMKGMSSTGDATMSVQGPVNVRGTETLLLRSKSVAGIGPFKGSQTTESWFDPIAVRSLRFYERARRFLSTHITRVEIYPDSSTWKSDDGSGGTSPTDSSLDELSFIYFLRLLPGETDTTYRFNRHFDATRDPVVIRVARGGLVSTDLGTFSTVLMEMHVHDPSRYRGEGIIKVYLSDDKCRVPIRIDSNVPDVGSAVLTLRSYANPAPTCDFAHRP